MPGLPGEGRREERDDDARASIPWDADSLAACAEFQKMATEPGGRHVHASCSRLRSSIDRAVARARSSRSGRGSLFSPSC